MDIVNTVFKYRGDFMHEMKNDNKLEKMPLGKLIVSMALPSVAAQLINVLYNIVDRIYIGKIPDVGVTALTGLGVSLPVITLIAAFAAFAGMGGAPLSAIELGKGDKDKAEQILCGSFVLILIFSIVLTIFFMIFKTPLLYWFGASENTIGYAEDYLNIYLLGTIFVQTALGLNTFISCQGNAKTAMLSVLIGAVLNIILDYVFIFIFELGIKGAALATIISQAVSAVWVLRFLFSKRSVIKIKKKNFKIKPSIVKKILTLGISPFIMQSTESFIIIILNSGLKKYGNDFYVGSLTVMQSVMQLIVVPIQGITQGVQPIISYNFGAKNYDRIRKTFKTTLAIALTATLFLGASAVIFPEILARIFTDDIQLIEIINTYMPVFMCGMCIFGIQMACQATFMGLGQAKISLFMAVLRKIILLIPLALILPIFFGVSGVYLAEPIADFTAATVTGTVFMFSFEKILRNNGT